MKFFTPKYVNMIHNQPDCDPGATSAIRYRPALLPEFLSGEGGIRTRGTV